MAIEVNGVSLPDIPEGFFDAYPSGVIVKCVSDADGSIRYTLYGTSGLAFVSLAAVLGCDFIVSMAKGVISCTCSEGDSTWTDPVTDESAQFSIGVGNVSSNDMGFNDLPGMYTAVWANCDIYTNTSDSEGNPVEGDIWFFSSTTTFEEEYNAPGTWFEGMARQVGRVTGNIKRFTTDEMLSALEGYETLGYPVQMKILSFNEVTVVGLTCYTYGIDGALLFNNLIEGAEYVVVWDGVRYNSTVSMKDEDFATLGNVTLLDPDLGVDTGEPFLLYNHTANNKTVIYARDTNAHTLSLYSIQNPDAT